MTNANPVLVVVSHYAARGIKDLGHLLKTMAEHDSGHPYDLLIVSNTDQCLLEAMPSHQIHHEVREVVQDAFRLTHAYNDGAQLLKPGMVKHLVRKNLGMNLGAWEFGWRSDHSHSSYLFVQDETFVKRSPWLLPFVNKFRSISDDKHKPILLGESWNQRWDIGWDEIKNKPFNYPIKLSHSDNQLPLIRRSDYYKEQISMWKIRLPSAAGHLRSLILFTNRLTLDLINGIHIGKEKEQCIAAEMAISFSVIAHGGICSQVSERPFWYFGHSEWIKNQKIRPSYD
ncbi:MAG: hypothetical protein EBU08_04900 [Micrococcales bacterium]|nr:hypothetical protein [Micrococcales bacterium]